MTAPRRYEELQVTAVIEYSSPTRSHEVTQFSAPTPDFEDLGHAFPTWNPPERDAILQPPKPEIQPSAKIVELAREREAGREAAD